MPSLSQNTWPPNCVQAKPPIVLPLKAYRGSVDLQPHPAAGLGQGPHRQAAGRFVGAEFDLVGAPVGAVIPAAVVELQHDRFGRIGRVEKHVGHQLVAVTDQQRVAGGGEKVLAQARGGPLAGALAAEHRLRRADPMPRLVFLLPIGDASRGQRVVNPDILTRLGRQRDRGRGRIGRNLGQFLGHAGFEIAPLARQVGQLRRLLGRGDANAGLGVLFSGHPGPLRARC